MKQERQREKQIRAYDRSHGAKQCLTCRRWFTAKPRNLTLPLCPRCERAAAKEGRASHGQ